MSSIKEEERMATFIRQSYGSIGFGVSEEEALEDAYINACSVSLSNDLKEMFKKRRESINPWMPTSNMLHLSGIGCLVYSDNVIKEISSGNEIEIDETNNMIFYYLSMLFGDRLSYTDIICVLREEIDIFFTRIKSSFIPIRDMPMIQVTNETNDFYLDVMYRTSEDFIIGCTETMIGIKFLGEDAYYTCPINSISQQKGALYRLLYRTGYVLIGNRLLEI